VESPEPAPEREVRYAVAPVTGIEVRDPTGNDDNTWTMSGYAAVFGQDTTLYDGRFMRLTESISPAAFDRVLREQPMDMPTGVVHYNLGHDMNRAVAATDVPAGQPGSLVLEAHRDGLYFMARVPRDDPDGVAMAAKMRSGVLRQASFAFTVNRDERTITEAAEDGGAETEHREILEVGHLYDVCATPQGAYPTTIAGLRSYAAAIGQPPLGEATHVSREGGGVTPVSPELGGGAASTRTIIDLRIASARKRYKKEMG
jgi:HK97 family phage prohead protease